MFTETIADLLAKLLRKSNMKIPTDSRCPNLKRGLQLALFAAISQLTTISLTSKCEAAVIENTFLEIPRFEAHGSLLSFPGNEQTVGDLNGDGDSTDRVLQFYSIESDLITNTGLSYSEMAYPNENHVIFGVAEITQGQQDLNNDGDLQDQVLHVWDVQSGTAVNLGIAASTSQLSGQIFTTDNLLATAADESANSNDFNGDGDTSDRVLHVYEFATKTLINVGFAVSQIDVASSKIAFTVSEHNQGQTDLNGNGSTHDTLAFLFDIVTHQTKNLNLAAHSVTIDDVHVVLSVLERSEFHTDLNADGDTLDSIIHIYNHRTDTTTNLGLADSSPSRVLTPDLVAFRVSEGAQANTDLNGDGDSLDNILFIHNFLTGQTTNIGFPIGLLNNLPSPILVPHHLDVEHNTLAFLVDENNHGSTDLNSDGDANDLVLHLYDINESRLINLGTSALPNLAFHQGSLVFAIDESSQGQSDLNNDGDVNHDQVLHVYDVANKVMTNTELATYSVGPATGGLYSIVADGQVAFVVREGAQGETDLNGDGEVQEPVLHTLNLASNTLINTGFAPTNIRILPHGTVAFIVSEQREGLSYLSGVDINGDGDDLDQFLYLANNTEPANLITNLIDEIESEVELSQGLNISLTMKLANAAGILMDHNTANDKSACHLLEAMIRSVEAKRGKGISESDADFIIRETEFLITLSCP